MTERIAGLLAVRRKGWGWWGSRRPSYRGFRYTAEIINHCVWLYHRFPLSLREVQEMMLARGIIVSHETVRQWCAKFGQTYANGLRRRRPRPGDKWHLDEVFITINGKRQYLWRAVESVAGGGPARECAGHSGYLPARCEGRDRHSRLTDRTGDRPGRSNHAHTLQAVPAS